MHLFFKFLLTTSTHSVFCQSQSTYSCAYFIHLYTHTHTHTRKHEEQLLFSFFFFFFQSKRTELIDDRERERQWKKKILEYLRIKKKSYLNDGNSHIAWVFATSMFHTIGWIRNEIFYTIDNWMNLFVNFVKKVHLKNSSRFYQDISMCVC